MRVGVHTSIAGALEKAAHQARRLGCDTFQMFSGSPRGWRGREPEAEAYQRFRAARSAHGLSPVVVHANYLINLASPNPSLRRLSAKAFRREIERAVKLGADYLVVHPGSATGSSAGKAVERCVRSLKEAAHGLALNGLTVLIENTAGQGSALGAKLEELAEILEGVAGEFPVGVCLDTAHLFAAGYGIHEADGLAATLRELNRTVRLERVRLIHANDSKADFGSRVDRHDHIGRGKIGRDAFRRIVRHPKLRKLPFICETPIDRPGDDKRNLRMMRKLADEL